MVSELDDYDLQKVYSKFTEPYQNTQLFPFIVSRHLPIFIVSWLAVSVLMQHYEHKS